MINSRGVPVFTEKYRVTDTEQNVTNQILNCRYRANVELPFQSKRSPIKPSFTVEVRYDTCRFAAYVSDKPVEDCQPPPTTILRSAALRGRTCWISRRVHESEVREYQTRWPNNRTNGREYQTPWPQNRTTGHENWTHLSHNRGKRARVPYPLVQEQGKRREYKTPAQ